MENVELGLGSKKARSASHLKMLISLCSKVYFHKTRLFTPRLIGLRGRLLPPLPNERLAVCRLRLTKMFWSALEKYPIKVSIREGRHRFQLDDHQLQLLLFLLVLEAFVLVAAVAVVVIVTLLIFSCN